MRYGMLLAAARMVSAAAPASAAVQLRVNGVFGSSVRVTYNCTQGTCTLLSSSVNRGGVSFTVFAPDSVLTDTETIVTGTSADGLSSFGAKILNANGFLSAINLVSQTQSVLLTPNYTGIRFITTTTVSNGTVFNLTAAAVPGAGHLGADARGLRHGGLRDASSSLRH